MGPSHLLGVDATSLNTWLRIILCISCLFHTPAPDPPHPTALQSLTPRYAYIIKCTGFTMDPSTGKVVELQAEADLAPAGKKPPKGILNWVAQPKPGQEPIKAEVRAGGRGAGDGREGDQGMGEWL